MTLIPIFVTAPWGPDPRCSVIADRFCLSIPESASSFSCPPGAGRSVWYIVAVPSAALVLLHLHSSPEGTVVTPRRKRAHRIKPAFVLVTGLNFS